MATKLTKPVSRETALKYRGRNIIVTIAPIGGQADFRIGFRLKGERGQYVSLGSTCYQIAALHHGNREKIARKRARKEGVSWRSARKKFIEQNSIQNLTKEKA